MMLEFNTAESSPKGGEGGVEENKRLSLGPDFDFTFNEGNPFDLDQAFLPPREDLSWALEGL